MVCADTDFLVALERHDPDALRKVRELAVRGDTLYVTVISVAEFYRGAYGMRDREGAISSARSLLGLFAILNLDYESGRIWGELSFTMKSTPIGDRDLFIASIALSNRQGLLTKNLRYFERIPGLVVEDW